MGTEIPVGFVCVSFTCNNRLGNQIKSYKDKKEEGETKVRQMGTAANCTFDKIGLISRYS